MSETSQIAAMAIKVADDLFKVFKWERKIAEDHSWDCVAPELHGDKKDHPSDCVFFYKNPYDNEIKYINTDLKSYAKKSITKDSISTAIHSLTYATNCASFNPNWKKLYHPETSSSVLGMLFVYNHCNEYNGDFNAIIDSININHNHLDARRQVYVCGPKKVNELYSIANDIRTMTGKRELPFDDEFCFFHPNEMMTKNHFDSDYNEPATIEILTSPWIIVKHAKVENCLAGYLIYYTGEGEEVDEFMYLLDALSYYQILNNKNSVRIKFTKNNSHSSLNLTVAIKRYFNDLGHDDKKIDEMIELIVRGTIDEVHPKFSPIEIGVLS